MSIILSLIFVLFLVSTSFASKCDGSVRTYNCDADYSNYCAACPSGSDNCLNGYVVDSRTVITGQVCGTSSLVSTTDPSDIFNQQMCCPSSTYINETYSCTSVETAMFHKDGDYQTTYKGKLYQCATGTPSYVDEAVSKLMMYLTLLIVALSICCICAVIGCGCSAHWCIKRRRAIPQHVSVSLTPTYGYDAYSRMA